MSPISLGVFGGSLSVSMDWHSAVLDAEPEAFFPFTETSGNPQSAVNGYSGVISDGTFTQSETGLYLSENARVLTDYVPGSVNEYSVETFVETTDGVGTISNCRSANNGVWSFTLHLGTSPGATAASGTPTFGVDAGSYYQGRGTLSPIHNGQFHHVVGVWEGSTANYSPLDVRIYVDGARIDDRNFLAGNIGSPTVPINLVGTTEIGYARQWASEGRLDMTNKGIAFYHRALSLSEVLERAQLLGVA